MKNDVRRMDEDTTSFRLELVEMVAGGYGNWDGWMLDVGTLVVCLCVGYQ